MPEPNAPTIPILDAAVDPDRAAPVDLLLDLIERVGLKPATFAAGLLATLRRLAEDGRVAQGVVRGVADELATAIRWRATT
jgi:hypothetical protein